jgi:hypothetical protein
MADFRSTVVQGGLGLRAAQDYDEQQAQRTHAQRAREYGVRVMESEERRRGAADTLLDKDTEIKRLRQNIEAIELAAKKETQPAEIAQRRSDIEHRGRMQPGGQRLETIQQGVATGAAEAAQKLQPGQIAITGATQNLQRQTLQEQEAASIWGLLSVGDKAGALELMNKSTLLHPGRKFSGIERGGSPARGNDGKPLIGPDGNPVEEKLVRLVAADGGEDVIVPQKKLEANAQKYGSRYEKSGNNYIRINPDGTVTPVYEPDQYVSVPEGGSAVSRRTGLPPAAGGINQPGQRPPGSDRATGRIDERVGRGKGVVDRFFGISDLSGLDPRNQPKYSKIIERMGVKVRAGQDPEAAATAAINEVNHEEAALAAAGRPGGAAAYSGPTPWRR